MLSAQSLQLQNLTCDYRTNPLGVEKRNPVFAWQLVSSLKNTIQTSYQILVSTDSNALKKISPIFGTLEN